MATYLEQMEELARTQGGYFYPWRSTIAPGDGETAYTALVSALLRPERVVLEAGCGHGPDIARFAPRVARYIAYDYAPAFVALARADDAIAALGNVELHVVDSSPARGGRLPAADGAVDLIISRRGPTNFILDAPRAVRPGGTLIQLNPAPGAPPAWNDALPTGLRIAAPEEDIEARVAGLLDRAGLFLATAETFDVAETFSDPLQLWLCLGFLKPDAPAFVDAQAALDALFRDHAGPDGIELRHRRFLWTARL